MRMTNQIPVQDSPAPETKTMIEQLVERENMTRALKRVEKNKGAPGVDGMTTKELRSYLKDHWEKIKEELLTGSYRPSPVKQVTIPKPNGGERKLGIPTVLDRLIQQALHQLLNPIFDPEFSESSFGFRTGRSTVDAVKQAQSYQQSGKRWVVDMDLANFFDEVNHDRLISRIRKKVKDHRIIKLIRQYLRTGIMTGGVTTIREKGTPQGSPLSPLLSNIVLDELDKELESRGHSFCRYADDCNIYVRSRKAGERVLNTIKRFVEDRLRLRLNQQKSEVSRPWKRVFLGYSFTMDRNARLRVPAKSVKRFKKKLKAAFRKGRGRNMFRFINEDINPIIRGWINYFRHAEVKGFAEDLDGWIRRHMRKLKWKQWKKGRTRCKELIKRGLDEARAKKSAFNGFGSWWNSGASHMNAAFKKKYFDTLGLVSMLDVVLKFRKH